MNNSTIGIMIQGAICKKYNIDLPDGFDKLYESNFNEGLGSYINIVVDEVFEKTGLIPVGYDILNKKGFNFILSNGKSLSIRTNTNGDKICPRVIGQAGYGTLNKYFSEIYGDEINDHTAIKKLVINHMKDIFPLFVNHLFDADYLLWFYMKNDGFKYKLIKKALLNYDVNEINFTFTKDLDDWNESTTLKANDISIAEIQVHKNRSFKFRFNMFNLLKLMGYKNETL